MRSDILSTDMYVLQLYLLSTIDISSICKNTNGHARMGNIKKSIQNILDLSKKTDNKLYCSREMLSILLRVVVLETD
jgi:hypothetical protein